MMDRPLGPQSQDAVHKKLHAVHKHDSQQEKDPERNPTTEIQSNPDPTVQTHY